jgi:hypothetical protein
MANAQAVSTSFKTELLGAYHNFIATNVARTINTVDVLKAALFLATGSQGAATTAYSATNEVSGTNYTAGGVTVTNATAPSSTGTTAFWTPSANLVWTTVTLATAFDCVTFYNSSQGNRAIASYTFGSQTVTAGNFTLTMPSNDSTNGLLRLA